MKKLAGVPALVPAVAVLAALVVSPGFAAQTGRPDTGTARHNHKEKIENIRKLVHIMSGKQLKDMTDKMLQSSLQTIESQMPAEAQADPEMKQAFDDYLRSLPLTEKDLEEMLDLMIPYYDKYLDEADVRDLVAFYESPAGAKFVRVMPEMMAEMMPQIINWELAKLKAPMEALRKKLEGIEGKRRKEKPAAGRQD